jgi:formylglycine-generating enzyme
MKKNLMIITCLALFSGLCANAAPSKKNKSHVKIPDGYVFIPQGSVVIDDTEHTVSAFIMAKHEVTNKQYREFLNHLKTSGRNDDYAIAMVDTTVWDIPNSYLEPFKTHYFSHPAYDNYPVVGVSYEGALLYCKWQFEQLKDYGLAIEMGLPQRVQWVYAASGGLKGTKYPWGGPYLLDSKGKQQCNYKVIGDERISHKSEDGTYRIETGKRKGDVIITNVVGAYPKNAFGLFDMSGNVAEMTAEKGLACGGSWYSPGYDVRIFSTSTYKKADAFTGFRPVGTFVKL